MRQTSRAPLYAAAICLVCFLVCYALLWLTVIWAVLLEGWTGTVAGLDAQNIIHTLTTAERVLIITACIFITLTLAALALKLRLALYTACGTLMSHFAAWILMADNPYYSAQPGFFFLPAEGLALTLIVLLIRRRTLR
jgi:hypothetical protein